MKQKIIPVLIIFILTPLMLSGDGIFWGYPEQLPSAGKFIQTASSDNYSVAVWQEFLPDGPGSDQGKYYFSLRRSTDGLTWNDSPRCLGPFPYPVAQDQYRKYTVLIDPAGRLLLATSSDDHTVTVYGSVDQGASFQELARLNSPETVNVPLLSLSSRNELLMFVTYLLKDAEGIYVARSPNGREWSQLTSLVTEKLEQPELPFHTVFKRREYIVFQARLTKAAEFQLFLKTSGDGGNTWSEARSLTDSMGVIDGVEVPITQISNQRPFLLPYKNELLVTWERNRSVPPRPPQVYVMSINENGRTKDDKGKFKPEWTVSSGLGYVYNPQLILYKDRLYHLWFENQSGQPVHVFFCAAPESGKGAVPLDLSPNFAGDSLYPQAVVMKGALSLFWYTQRKTRNLTEERVVFLGPDRFTAPPLVSALNFTDTGFGRLLRLRFRWEKPEDSSGINDIYWAVSRQKNISFKDAKPTEPGISESQADIAGEGAWYVSVFAVDAAGNVSAPAQLVYTRDTTPPGVVRFLSPEKDSDGYFPANTFTVTWAPPPNDVIGGYSFRLRQLSDNATQSLNVSPKDAPVPEETPGLSEPKVDFNNLDNGVWALAVSAFDKAGNKGEAAVISFRLNHYQAHTYITAVSAQRDPSGRLLMTILGRGFLEGGAVDNIIIDKDGQPPYNFEFSAAQTQFKVESDRLISGIPLDDVEEGVYQIGVHHPRRGYYFSGKETLKIDSSYNIKYGDYSPSGTPLTYLSQYLISLSFGDIMLWLIVFGLIALFFLAGRKVYVLVRETTALQHEVRVFIQGGDLPMSESKKKIAAWRRKGIGLRLKFTLLISLLALLIVAIVAIPISFAMIRIQQGTLAQKLKDEVNIVLSGIVDGTKTYLVLNNSLLVSENLEKQFKQLPESAEMAVVTGPRFINPKTGETDLFGTTLIDVSSMEHIWSVQPASADVTLKKGTFTPIDSEIADDISPKIAAMAREIDGRAADRVGSLDKELDAMADEQDHLLFRTDKTALDRKTALDARIKDYKKQRDSELEKIASAFQGSVPVFDQDNINLSIGTYLFYKPVVTRVRNYDHYFYGLARLKVSTGDINRQIQISSQTLIIVTGAIALIALGLGIAGALILASIIITPLRRLSRAVAVIRDTADKSALKDHHITIRTRDELHDLAETVNQMTQGLVRAAEANKDLVVGQEIQKMFIPLETGPNGKKCTTGSVSNDFVDIFGYYEGATVVSGDYFDFKKLDDRYFAIIKCDVAGHGVAGSLIMIEVATLFLSYFKEWSLKKDGLKIDNLVLRINDMLEERGFKGRFAQLTLCLLNSETGMCHMCHAGDKELHIYRHRNMKMETITLANTPAAGVFHSTLIPPPSGFRVENQKLEKGDILFLFTDGIEEAQRVFRDGTFAPTICSEPGLKEGESHGGTHNWGKSVEELGMKRVYSIIEAVCGRSSFTLFKYHNPLANEELIFDFSGCQGTSDEAVLAMAAVEKVFRIYPDASAAAQDLIRVDRKIDAFLARTFSGYRAYFKTRSEKPDEPDYVFFAGLKEDEQKDDLTILGVRKK
jgi:HAMP domain-containing protein